MKKSGKLVKMVESTKPKVNKVVPYQILNTLKDRNAANEEKGLDEK